jgi:hypothetical protein
MKVKSSNHMQIPCFKKHYRPPPLNRFRAKAKPGGHRVTRDPKGGGKKVSGNPAGSKVGNSVVRASMKKVGC